MDDKQQKLERAEELLLRVACRYYALDAVNATNMVIDRARFVKRSLELTAEANALLSEAQQ